MALTGVFVFFVFFVVPIPILAPWRLCGAKAQRSRKFSYKRTQPSAAATKWPQKTRKGTKNFF
jgi:hypothetical protein